MSAPSSEEGPPARPAQPAADLPAPRRSKLHVGVELLCLALLGALLGVLCRAALGAVWPRAPRILVDNVLAVFSLPFILTGEATLALYREARRTGSGWLAVAFGAALMLAIPLILLLLVLLLDLVF